MNIYNHTLPSIGEEFTTLLESKNIKIVKIVSSDNINDIEYCQNENEFVVLIEGSATIEIEGDIKKLKRGDYLYIPALKKHKVIKTSKGTLWIAIHFK